MDVLPTIVAAGTAGVVLRFAAAFFLVVVGVAFVYMLVRAGRAFQSVDKLVTDLDTEIMPVINKAGTTIDEVNSELGKVNDITASVADMTERVDSATRAVETALSSPARKAAAFTSGVTQSVSSFFSRHGSGWSERAEAESEAAGPATGGQSDQNASGASSWTPPAPQGPGRAAEAGAAPAVDGSGAAASGGEHAGDLADPPPVNAAQEAEERSL
jgi:uncharacterized protein YoxC